MTATLLEARQGIADVLRLVEGLDNVYAFIPASPTPPCAMVLWPTIWTPDLYLGGSTAWEATVPVQVLVLTGSNDSADRTLSGFLEPSGASSIVAAFDDNADLNGLLNGYAVCRNVTDIGMVAGPDDGVRYLSATFNLDVHTT
jgi:hypothetical protein